MLTRVENFAITLVPHVFSRRGHVRIDIGKRFWEWRKWRLTKEEFDQFLLERHSIPYRFQVDTKHYWLFEDKLYKDTEELTPEDVRALLITRQRLQRSRINRAKTLADSPATTREKALRTALPDDVKLLVWQRDLGRCVKCGSMSELQFDHIIPFSLGGASTPENLQILCGSCNRAKSNSIV